MILHTRILEQAIDRGERARFVKEILVTPGKVPLSIVRKRLYDDRRGRPVETAAAVLLVHGFGQNRYAWHLPSRSLANHLAASGYDVHNVDLRGHGRSRHLGGSEPREIEEYVTEDLPRAVEEVQLHSGKRPVFLAGHSLGGLLVYAAAPALAGSLAGMVSLGSPYHFTRGSSSLRAIGFLFRAVHAHGAPNLKMPMASLGRALRKVGRFAESPLYPVPLRGWHRDSLEPHILDEHLRLALDRGGVRELATMFQWAGERRFGGKLGHYAERFEKLDVPLLVVAGANDTLAPPPSVRPAHDRSRSTDKMYRALPVGHIDMLVGRAAPHTTWPLLTSWLQHRAARGGVAA
jgi:pimeloyl-ACP methyl ester carboxylesterase